MTMHHIVLRYIYQREVVTLASLKVKYLVHYTMVEYLNQYYNYYIMPYYHVKNY